MSKHETYALQGIFRIDTLFGGPRRGRETVYEARVLHVLAGSERAAKRVAHARFARDTWTATWPAPDVAKQTQVYEGLSRVVCLGPELDEGEVWYEFRDDCPAVERPRRR